MKAKARDTRQLLSVFTATVLFLASPWNIDAQIISTVAGGGPVAGPALEIPLGTPTSVAADGAGNIFIAAQKLNRVIKVDSSGQATMFAGASALGAFSGDGGPAASAGLNAPVGVAVDSSGNVYIADQANHRIRKVNATTGVITTVAGNGNAGFSGDGGPAASASLNTPVGIGIDGTGNLYIADQSDPVGPVFGRRVRKVNVATGVITTVAGNGSSTFAGDGGLAINAGLTARGVATDSAGNLYIADQSNRRVRKVNTAGVITTVAGNGISGFSGDGGVATNARLRNPFGVALDTAGNLYIADNSTQRVRKVDAASGVITTVAGSGDETPDFGGDGGLATGARLANPQSVAVDGAGNLLIADSFNQRVRQVDATGGITTVAGNGFFGFNGDDRPAVGASLVGPPGVTVDSAGNVFIADQSNQRIRKVDAVTGVITTVAGDGRFGFGGDGGPATSASLAIPGDVAVDSGGNVFITDLANRRVRRVEAVTGVITTVAGDGNTGFSGDGGPATSASLSAPSGVAIDGAGNLFVADDTDQRVRRIDAATGVITTVAGNGTAGFSGDGGLATGASLSSPANVAVDSAGNLFIADLANHRVRRVDAVTGVITTVAGNGTPGFSGDGGPATSASLASPAGIAVDGNGDLFIADRSNQRVRKVDAASGVITTVAGSNALPGFSGDGGLATSARLADPFDVAVDSVGNVVIADFSNDRVRLLTWLPDLVERVLSAVPATAEPGTSFDVTDRIRNRGDRPASATTTRYYLSVNTRKNRVDKRLAGTRAIPTLDPGENSTGTVTVTIPRSTANGTYFLLACADDVAPTVAESNERNNCGASDTTIQVARPPDLVEIRVADPPANAAAGSTFNVTDKVRNRGKGPIAPTTTRYFLSTDTLRKGADKRLTGTRAVPALAPGEVSKGRAAVTIPRDTPSGTYFLLACADNLAPKIQEISELNNCSASTATIQVIGRPDLVEVRVTDPPATAAPGTSFDVTDRVTNRGTGPALETTTRYYLSLDQLRNTGDRRLTGSRAVPALDPGETSRGRVTVTIPTNTAPGTYFLIACADNAAPVVAESNERNNCRASAGTMIVAP